MEQTTQIAGYILAGGRSRRMGENKAFLRLGKETFLERIRAALSCFDTVYLSVDSAEKYERTGFTLIEDLCPDAGPMGGIVSGLLSCPQPALFVAACDMPFVDRGSVEVLLDAYKKEQKPVVAKTGERIHPLFGIYPKSVLTGMLEMVERGEYRMMDFLERTDHAEVQIGAGNRAAVNVNSREEYRELTEEQTERAPVSVEEAVDMLTRCVLQPGGTDGTKAGNVENCGKTKEVGLPDALGRILAKDAVAQYDQPPFPRSPLDGYALRAADTKNAGPQAPVCLEVVGETCAGQIYSGRIKEGQALRIMTGAPIPEGADTVVKQENTDCGEETVKVYESLEPFSNYCRAGEDYEKGEVLLEKGTKLDGIALGILAGMGMETVSVLPRPCVGVISTGDELCSPGQELPPGRIYDSNRYLIGGRLKELGLTPAFSLHCDDSAQKMVQLIKEKAQTAQLIITTGGVSVGKKDILHEVIRLLGARRLFWKVELKPGSPALAAVYKDTMLICLSGNPFAAAANFELLVRPVIAGLTGDPSWVMQKKQARFHGAFAKKSGRRRFIRAYYEDGGVSIPRQKHASGILSTFAGCNCLIDIEKGNEGLKEGDTVWVHLM